ncbi:MAG TPA: glycosyltransferase [Terriglobales bacterium]
MARLVGGSGDCAAVTIPTMLTMPVIGHVNKYWGRDRGGVEAVLHASVQDLSRRGYGVEVLACRPWRSPARPFPPGVAGRELAAPVVASMPVHWEFGAALAQIESRCDLLHFHLPFPLAEAATLRLPKRIPWVATWHAEVLGRSPMVQWAQQAVSRRFLQRVDAIVVSAPASSHSDGLRPFPERVHLIPFGFDWRAFSGPRPRRDAGHPAQLIFVGRLVPYKGLDVLLRAMTTLPARLQIVGDGRERSRLQRLAARLQVADRVEFLGHLPDAELPSRLAAADIFVLPSRTASEAFGVAQLEAMAAGLPVVNTALATGTDWVSLDGVTGLTVAPDNPVQLAAALRHLIEDRDFRLACGRRARRRARDLFSIEARGAEMVALYEGLLAPRSKMEVFPLRTS